VKEKEEEPSAWRGVSGKVSMVELNQAIIEREVGMSGKLRGKILSRDREY
jgi:hypothetical protein